MSPPEVADVKRYTPVHSDAVTSVTVAGDVSYITGSADQVMYNDCGFLCCEAHLFVVLR